MCIRDRMNTVHDKIAERNKSPVVTVLDTVAFKICEPKRVPARPAIMAPMRGAKTIG